ncbi:4'-phosphopantetheinyl transferase [Burkholderiaceae bacterium]|nr:4'-phosphopantetheinyl transferase [Burkholderiaceae bacterium]
MLSLAELAPLIGDLPADLLPPDIRRSVPSRQLAFAAGRLCAEHAMQALQGRAQCVARGEGGEPLWPDGMDGSITHTSAMAAAAVGASMGKYGIGIDSEFIADDEVLRDILHVCCTADERQRLFGGVNDRLVATIVFSAKEALFKAIHRSVRRMVDFDEAEVSSIDWTRQQVRIGGNSGKPRSAEIPMCLAEFRVQGDSVHTSAMPR